ncbi:MAG: hypothetical protein AAFX04_08095 [Pseudomonadota bacterium]
MKNIALKMAAFAMAVALPGAYAQAQFPSDGAFLQCMQDCQDFMPDVQTVRLCENWCYIEFDPG